MIPLALFLLACLAVYAGTVLAAFSLLMRLPLRLNAERDDRLDALGPYLEDPLRLFAPARLLEGLVLVVVAVIAGTLVDGRGVGAAAVALAAAGIFVLVCVHLLPLLVVRRDPERVLEWLLPSVRLMAGLLGPVTAPLVGLTVGLRGERETLANGATGPTAEGTDETASRVAQAEIDEREERRLLQSVVEFGGTLVREVMTPRPDIVAVQVNATLAELRAVFVEQQYSRIPVYEGSLDNVLGFVFVKDLVPLFDTPADERVVQRLLRPASLVPETKRVAELLKEFQRAQVQIAIVHDEYGGTAGLVTIEDLLEEIVGEIRDEYDVETEPVVDEGNGAFVFSGTVGVDDLADRLHVEIERQGFETVGGYLLARLGRVPHIGEVFDVDGLSVEVLEAERRRVHRVRVERSPETTVARADPS